MGKETKMKKIILLNVAWMEKYQGLDGDILANGGNNDQKHEVFNFEPQADGNCYGFVFIQGNKRIDLNKFKGECKKDKDGNSYIDDTLVVFTAREPNGRKKIVGWYNHARLYSDWVNHPYPKEILEDGKPKWKTENTVDRYKVCCKKGDAVCLPLEARIPPSKFFGEALGKVNRNIPLYYAKGNDSRTPGWSDGFDKLEKWIRKYKSEDVNVLPPTSENGGNIIDKSTAPIEIDGNGEYVMMPWEADLNNALRKCLEKLYSGTPAKVKRENIQGSKGRSDAEVRFEDGSRIIFEIKAHMSAKLCIRHAVGQLLEYSNYPGSLEAKKLVIVSDEELSDDDKCYLSNLKKIIKNLHYQRILPDNTLDKDDLKEWFEKG